MIGINQYFFITDTFQHLATLFSSCLDIFPCLLYISFLCFMLAVDNEKPKLANCLKILLRHNIENSLSCSFILSVCTYGYGNQNNDVVIMQIHELIA